MIRKVFKFFLAIGLFLGVQQLVELSTHGFYIQKIQADDLPYQPSWEAAPLEASSQESIDRLLSQPYKMIGAGSECFAFVSEDGEAVIKFFKLDFARPVYVQRGLLLEDHSALAGAVSDLPLAHDGPSLIKRLLGIREFRILRTFGSIKLAYDNLQEETGLLYLHLNPTQRFHRPLVLIDACGIRHEIDLDSAKFFLQKKAVPLEAHFTKIKGNDALAKESIDSLLDLLLSRCKKGFSDRDIRNRNFGYIGTKAIEIDSGSFIPNPRMRQPWLYRQEIFYGTLEFKSWLKKYYPEMAPYLETRVDEIVRQRL